MANNELLDKVMNKINEDPVHWNQSVWRTYGLSDDLLKAIGEGYDAVHILEVDCGTSFCFAGWAIQLSGEKVQWYDTDSLYANEEDHDIIADIAHDEFGNYIVDAEYRAERLLGIDSHTSGWLFNGGNTKEDLAYYVNQIKAGKTGDDIIYSRNQED